MVTSCMLDSPAGGPDDVDWLPDSEEPARGGVAILALGESGALRFRLSSLRCGDTPAATPPAC